MGHPHTTGPSEPTESFGPFTLDSDRGVLLRAGEEVKLRPKSFDLLRYLAHRSGRLVGKAELTQALWPDAVVGDDALPHCIMEVRKALGEDGHRIIKTVPARGYVFEADLTLLLPVMLKVAKPPPRRWYLAAGAISLIAVSVSVALWRSHNTQSAWAAIPQIEALAANGKYFEAWDLASEVAKQLPDNPRLKSLTPVISDDLSVITTPPGASVYLTRFDVKRPESGTRMLAGSTPVRHLKIARGEYILSLEKPGYTSFERTISSSLNRTEHPNIFNWSISVEHAFAGISAAPSDMAGVPGGDYELRAWDSPAYAKASLGDFYIDKFEVSNREFKEFIDAGGYVQKQFWNYPFLSNGRILDWEQAVAEFKDRTGLAAPRSWQGGMYPENKGSYPVTDITWYEAAAYAAFRGKRLPTIFEWEKSARVNSRVYKGMMAPWGLLQGDVLALRANFDSRGTAPVSTLPFGMSPYGAYHMAGNVREWCLNSYNEGYVTAGGSWRDPFYRFGSYGATPAFHTSDTLGFRCVLPLKSGSAGDGGATRFQAVLKPPIYTPTSIPYFQTLLRHYRYDKTSLNAKVISEQDYPDWRQITIAYNGANDERTLAALCLPRNTAGPFQVIHYTAGSRIRRCTERCLPANTASAPYTCRKGGVPGFRRRPRRAPLAERPHRAGSIISQVPRSGRTLDNRHPARNRLP